jgi:hypothetical protein
MGVNSFSLGRFNPEQRAPVTHGISVLAIPRRSESNDEKKYPCRPRMELHASSQ